MPMGRIDMRGAAQGGHLEVLKWAREHHCRWNWMNGCASAAESGHLEVLKWAREHHCPWNYWHTHESARAHGRPEVLRCCGGWMNNVLSSDKTPMRRSHSLRF